MIYLPEELPNMEGKQIEGREAVRAAVEALDAPPTSPPDRGVAPDPAPGIAASDEQSKDSSTASALPPEEIERLTNEIVAALKTVYDPEIPADIYELGLIYKVEIDDDRNVVVNMTLTAPGCPVAGEMPIWVENAVNAVPGIAGTKVNIVFDPPWDQSRMSDEARLAVGMF
jgi:FeS assembly SUF system protein